MTWHYNLVKERGYITLREVFIDIDSHEGIKDAVSWTEEGVIFGGDTREEVIEQLELALKDAKRHRMISIHKDGSYKVLEGKNEKNNK